MSTQSIIKEETTHVDENLIVCDVDEYADIFSHYPRLRHSADGFRFYRVTENNWFIIGLTAHNGANFNCGFYDMINYAELKHRFAYVAIDVELPIDLPKILGVIKYILHEKGFFSIPIKSLPAQLTKINTYLDCSVIPQNCLVDQLPNGCRFEYGKFYITYEERDMLQTQYSIKTACCGYCKEKIDNGQVKFFINEKIKQYEEWYVQQVKKYFPVKINHRQQEPGVYNSSGQRRLGNFLSVLLYEPDISH